MSARVLAGSAALLLLPVLAGCSLLGLGTGASSDYDIHVSNGTTLDLAITVNGSVVDRVPAGQDGTVPAAALGNPPWDVVATTASGRRLAGLQVARGSVTCEDGPDGSRSCSGNLSVVDLSCGRLVLYATPTPPELPPPRPGAGRPGDCEP